MASSSNDGVVIINDNDEMKYPYRNDSNDNEA